MQANEPVVRFLLSALEAKAEYKRRQRRVATLESRCLNVTAKMSATPGGGGGSKGAEDLWALLADERTREAEAAAMELEKYHEVERFIDSLSRPERRLVLKLRYLDNMMWVPIWREMQRNKFYFSERQIYRIHGAALQEARRAYAQMTEGGAARGVHPEATSEVLH